MNYRDIALVVAFLAMWIVLNRWVLPWFGVPTCMSGGCSSGSCPAVREEVSRPQPPEGEP